MPEQEAIDYITKRIATIEADEKEFQEHALQGTTMQFSTDDVIQELNWVLEKLRK